MGFSIPAFFYANLFHGIRLYDIVSMMGLIPFILIIVLILSFPVSMFRNRGEIPDEHVTILWPFILLLIAGSAGFKDVHFLFILGSFLLMLFVIGLPYLFFWLLWQFISWDILESTSTVMIYIGFLAIFITLISLFIPSIGTLVLLGGTILVFLIVHIVLVMRDNKGVQESFRSLGIDTPGLDMKNLNARKFGTRMLIIIPLTIGLTIGGFSVLLQARSECEWWVPSTDFKIPSGVRMRISSNGSDLVEEVFSPATNDFHEQGKIMIGHDNNGVAEYGSRVEDFENLKALLHVEDNKRIHIFTRERIFSATRWSDDTYEDTDVVTIGAATFWEAEKPKYAPVRSIIRDTGLLVPVTLLLVIGEVFGSELIMGVGKKIQEGIITRSLREPASRNLFYAPPCIVDK